MTPEQARAARAFLNLDMKTVCEQAPVGKRTLTEFERGSRAISDTTLARLKGYYLAQGIVFRTIDDGDAIMRPDKISLSDGTVNSDVRPKLEYDDRFGLSELSRDFEKLAETISTCQDSINLSRDILLLLMTTTNLKQMQIAKELNCSAAFFSAVLLQKKVMSIDLACKIRIKYGINGLSEIVQSEKRFKKLLADMQNLAKDLVREVDRVKNVNNIL